MNEEDNRSNLRWVSHHGVVNSETRSIIARVCQIHWADTEASRKGWPPGLPEKATITPDMEGFNQLLASPNLYGVSRLLMEHQEQFKDKTVKSIQVYRRNPEGRYPYILVEIGGPDSPQDTEMLDAESEGSTGDTEMPDAGDAGIAEEG